MNIINNTLTKVQPLGILNTKQNILYRGQQSGRIYLGVRINGNHVVYLAELGEGLLCWTGNCVNDSTFIAIEADLVIKN